MLLETHIYECKFIYWCIYSKFYDVNTYNGAFVRHTTSRSFVAIKNLFATLKYMVYIFENIFMPEQKREKYENL